VGHQDAPAGIDARIMDRIAVVTVAAQKEKALLPPTAWALAGLALIGSIAWVLVNSNTADGAGYLDSLFRSMPRISLTNILASPWMMMGGGSLVALLGLEALLSRPPANLRVKS
jgi:hypothetical protein